MVFAWSGSLESVERVLDNVTIDFLICYSFIPYLTSLKRRQFTRFREDLFHKSPVIGSLFLLGVNQDVAGYLAIGGIKGGL